MKDNIADLGARNLNDVQSINRDLVEKALRMRCVSYLSQVKAKLLTETIYEIDSSKKNLQATTEELAFQKGLISRQKQELEQKNRELLDMSNTLEKLVQRRTRELENTVNELKESEERYRLIFTNSQSIMLLLDPEDGQIVDANGGAETFYGWTRAELREKKISDINTMPEEDVDREIRLAQSNRRNHFYFTHRIKSGEVCDVEVYSSPVQFHGHELLFSIIHDITKRRQAENALWESEETARALLNATTESAFLIDTEGVFIALNKVTADRLGMTVEELKGKCCFDYLPAEVAGPRKRVTQEVVSSGKPMRFEDERGGRILDTSLYPLVDNRGRVNRIALYSRDITREKNVEKTLIESERFHTSIVDSIRDGIRVLTPELDILYTNMAMREMFPGKGELTGRKCYEVFRERQEKCDDCPAVRALLSRNIERAELSVDKRDSGCRVLDISASPMFDGERRITGVVEVLRDVTEKKRMEKRLSETALQQKEAVSAANVGLWDWNLNTNKVFYSVEWKRQIGYEDHEIQNTFQEWEKRVHKEDLPVVHERLKNYIDGITKTFQTEFRFRHKDLSYRWILAKASLITDQDGSPERLIGSHLDITERVLAERKIAASLQEKEVLLREIHHRVKNNLAVIISLLNLQAGQTQESRTVDALNDSRDRVKSMALIHETLYRSDDFTGIDLHEYTETLGLRLLQVMEGGNPEVRMHFDVEGIHLDLDQAIPFGLILNELLTNALKYAFPVKMGNIVVSVRRRADHMIELRVHDDGIGIEGGIDDFESLGLSIVANLIENQLEGRLEFINDNGACFIASWPEEKSDKGEHHGR